VQTPLAQALGTVVDLTRPGSGAELMYSRVIEAAWQAVPGCDGASFVLWDGHRPGLHAATHPDLAAVDETQIRLGEGPGLTALRRCRTGRGVVELPDTLGDSAWPAYSAFAVDRGVRCCVATAFELPDGWGLLQLYGTAPGRLSRRQEAELALLASHTRAAARNLRSYTAMREEAGQMRAARASSTVIEQAKGVLMHVHGCDADTAFDRLRVLSQRQQVKLGTVAERLVREAAAGRSETPASR
jgi:hypothetical protein